MKLKEKYVAEHPESKDKVYHTREQREQRERPRAARPDPTAHLYNPDGTLRDPKRSIYYDATYNPFGVPPPGMPYAERPPSDDSDSDDSDSDSDIVMPDGPRPDESDADSDSDDSDDSDDIPLPAGPPPRPVRPPFRPPPRPPRTGWGHLMPGAAQPGAPGAPARPVRPPPPSFPVRPSSLPPRPPSLPAKPGTVSGPRPAAPAAAPAAATISAAPQLRDLRKEVTVFVPRAARKRAPGGVTVNATPGAGVVDADGDSVRVRAARPGLMDKLGRVLGDEEKKDQTEEEYERFLAGL
ncbi:uncharacterized protein COLE_07754 [Cutaneotrichosporon oleaginosum]|nr:hypothetical protein COLE_07754 [Cutaneotrichosporon oleaginosum]